VYELAVPREQITQLDGIPSRCHHKLSIKRECIQGVGCGLVVVPLLHAGGRPGYDTRLAAREREREHLRAPLDCRQEGDRVAPRRPARAAEPGPPGDQHALFPGGDVQQDELGVVTVRLIVRTRRDEGDGLPVGGDLRVGEPDERRQVVQHERLGLRGRGDGRGERDQGEKKAAKESGFHSTRSSSATSAAGAERSGT